MRLRLRRSLVSLSVLLDGPSEHRRSETSVLELIISQRDKRTQRFSNFRYVFRLSQVSYLQSMLKLSWNTVATPLALIVMCSVSCTRKLFPGPWPIILTGCGKTRFEASTVPRNSLVSIAQPDKKKVCAEKTSSS